MSFKHVITISDEAEQILTHLEGLGIYGRSVTDIIKRLLDRQLLEFIEKPQLKLTED